HYVHREIAAGRRASVWLIGNTQADVRRTQIKGASGLLATAPPWFRPDFSPALRRVAWPHGALVDLLSAEEPDPLRVPKADLPVCAELAAWSNLEETWSNIQFSPRIRGPLNDPPRIIVATTPRPVKQLRLIIDDPDTVVSRASTFDNAANLDPK